MPQENEKSPSLEALRKLLETADTERITRKDFEALAKQIIDLVKADKAMNVEQRNTLTSQVQSLLGQFESRLNASLDEMKSSAQSFLDEKTNKLMFDHDAMMAEMQTKMDMVQDGDDADEDEIVEKVLALLPPKEELQQETPEEIASKLETLEGDERLDAKAIKGLKEMIEKYTKNLGGGFVGAHAFSPTKLNASGTIDGSNATFAFAGKPTFVVVNGATYDEGYGWTYVNSNVVLDNAPPTNSRVYGIK